MDQICKSLNVNWSEVRELWLNDPRALDHILLYLKITKYHLVVNVYPKTQTYYYSTNSNGGSADFLKNVIDSNSRIES